MVSLVASPLVAVVDFFNANKFLAQYLGKEGSHYYRAYTHKYYNHKYVSFFSPMHASWICLLLLEPSEKYIPTKVRKQCS